MKKLGQKGIGVVEVVCALYAAAALIAGSFAIDAFQGNLNAKPGIIQETPDGNTSYWMNK